MANLGNRVSLLGVWESIFDLCESIMGLFLILWLGVATKFTLLSYNLNFPSTNFPMLSRVLVNLFPRFLNFWDILGEGGELAILGKLCQFVSFKSNERSYELTRY